MHAEYLGEEMGLYLDDNERMGWYVGEMLRACRLVVDTGLHAKQWTRAQVETYMPENAPYNVDAIVSQLARYMTMPGQACAYKIGQMKIKEIRKKAEVILGGRFDLKEFHSVLLTNGAIPLNLMEKLVNNWIKQVQTSSESQRSCSAMSLVSGAIVAILIIMHW